MGKTTRLHFKFFAAKTTKDTSMGYQMGQYGQHLYLRLPRIDEKVIEQLALFYRFVMFLVLPYLSIFSCIASLDISLLVNFAYVIRFFL